MKVVFGTILIAALFGQLCPCPVFAQSPSLDESIRVSQKILQRPIPGSPPWFMSDVFKALYPKLVPVFDERADGNSLVIDAQLVRGPFVYMDSKGIRPGSPHSFAVLIVDRRALDDGDFELYPTLCVLQVDHARLKPLATLELADFEIDMEPEHDGGSGYKLATWDVHPGAKGIVVTVLRSESGSDRNNATAELCMYFVSSADRKNELVEVYQSDVLDQTDEVTDDLTYSELVRIKTTVDKSSLFKGLRVLDVENYSSRTEDGRLRHVEIDYWRTCWNGDSFGDSLDGDCSKLTQKKEFIKLPGKSSSNGFRGSKRP